MPKPKKAKPAGEKNNQTKAFKKAERKRKAEEQQVQRQYEHLYREIKFGQETIRRHEKKWRSMMMEIAVPRLRVDLEYAWHNFERCIDAKDFQISLLMDELNDGEEQYVRNLKSHMDQIDKLIVLCYDQIGELWTESRDIISHLYTAATFEGRSVQGITKEHEDYLKTMLYMLDTAKKESSKLNRGEYMSRQQVEISKLNDICTKFTEVLKVRFEKMWCDSQDFLGRHITEYSARKKEFLDFTELDDEMQRKIKQTWERIRASFDTIKMLKGRFQEMQTHQTRNIADLSREMAHFDKVYKAAKGRVERERAIDDRHLTILTLKSNEVMEYLNGIELKGEQLLKLCSVCRKLETAEEKTMNFPDFDHDDFSLSIKDRENRKALEQNQEEEYLPELRLFWYRVAAAEASRFRISEQCQILREENEKLKSEIFAYCECIHCEPKMHLLYENINFKY